MGLIHSPVATLHALSQLGKERVIQTYKFIFNKTWTSTDSLGKSNHHSNVWKLRETVYRESPLLGSWAVLD